LNDAEAGTVEPLNPGEGIQLEMAPRKLTTRFEFQVFLEGKRLGFFVKAWADRMVQGPRPAVVGTIPDAEDFAVA
jgi:hypothetical protein